MLGHERVFHVEDVKEPDEATGWPVVDGGLGMNPDMLEVELVVHFALVERSAHIIKPHGEVHDEGFQDGCELAQAASIQIPQIWETVQIPILDLMQFGRQKAMQRRKGWSKIGLRVENRLIPNPISSCEISSSKNKILKMDETAK